MIYQDLLGRGKKPSSAKQWGSIITKFEQICGNKSSYDRADVIKYLAARRQAGIKQNTINKELHALKLLWQLLEIDKFPKLSMPKVKDSDISRPILTKDQIIQLIQRSFDTVSPRYQAFLALATIYGVRREEIARINPSEHIKNGQLTILTAKGGTPTNHLIPECLQPILKHFDPTDVIYLSSVFRRICRACGIKTGKRYGWHSIRRALVTELVISEASGLNIVRFMRWSDQTSGNGEFGMLTLYAKKDQAQIDKQIFAIHPFLQVWENPINFNTKGVK
jgi:integrase